MIGGTFTIGCSVARLVDVCVDARVGPACGLTSGYVGGNEASASIRVHELSTGVLGTLISAEGSFFDDFWDLPEFPFQ